MDIRSAVFYNGPHPFAKAHYKQWERILGTLFISPANQVTLFKL